MRTTLTIDDDVATRLLEQKTRTHQSLKGVINTLLRTGLDQVEQVREPSVTYKIEAVKLGNKLPDLDNISEILALDEVVLGEKGI